jgi:DNA processing protein
LNISKLSFIPQSLREISKPPRELFYVGNKNLLNMPKIAIVGTRKPSQYSRNIAYSLSSALSKKGIAIISGGALGTDIIVHRASINNTIAVMANSLDYIYPKGNEKDILEIAENGLLLSEYEKDVPAHPMKFIGRNRIMVGLSSVVIAIEADLESGTSQTMRLAKEMGKELYVIPHRLGESIATTQYLMSGEAKLIGDIDEFVSNMVMLLGSNLNNNQNFDDTSLNNKDINSFDEVLKFCLHNPTYEEAFKKFGEIIFEKELFGEIEIVNGIVRVIK